LSARDRYAKFLYLAKKYSDAITEIQKIQAKDSSDIILYRVLAYCQFENKDYKNGLININKFFTKAGSQPAIKVLASDYTYYGKLLSKNGQDSLAMVKMGQAATMLIASGATGDASDIYFQMGTISYLGSNCNGAIMYFQKRVQYTQNDVNSYYYLGRAAYDCKKYLKADSAFSTVISQRGDLLIGYQWKAYSDQAIDSNNTGSAIQATNMYIQKIGSDTVKNKDGMIISLGYLANNAYLKGNVEQSKGILEQDTWP
jgi:tetratricopeptide (TPR) repeat protein